MARIVYITEVVTALAAGAERRFQADRYLALLAATGDVTLKGTGANEFGKGGSLLPVRVCIGGLDGPIGMVIFRNDTGAPITFTAVTSNAPIIDNRDSAAAGLAANVAVTNAPSVDGQAAEGAVPAGNPHRMGGYDGAALRTLRTDAEGRQVALPIAVPADQAFGRISVGTTAETTLIAQVATKRHGLTGVVIANLDTAACTVDFRDSTGGTIRFSVTVPAGTSVTYSFPVPWWAVAVNTNWTAKLRAAKATNDIDISAQSFQVGY
jgi:hypothetical protein